MPFRSYLFVFFLLLSTSLVAQVNQKEAYYTSVMESVYAFEFGRADSMLRDSPSNCDINELDILKSNLNWWLIISGEIKNEKITQSYHRSTSDVIKRLEIKQAELNNDELAMMLHSYFLRSRFHLLKGSYLNALKDLQNCLNYTKQTLNKSDESESLKLGAGLYNYLIAKTYDENLLMRPALMFYPEGNIALGLEQIKACENSKNLLIKTESRYFLMKIYNDWENDSKMSLRYCEQLCADYPSNLIFKMYRIELLKKLENQQFETQLAKYKAQLQNEAYSANTRSHFVQVIEEKFN